MFPISYRDLELMLQDRGVAVDHTTLFRWIQAYAPELEKRIRPHLRACNGSWRVDETYIKVKGRWTYLYRAVDSRGQTIDFLLSAKRDAAAAKWFFPKALGQPHTVNPRTITVDKNAAYPAAVTAMKRDRELWHFSRLRQIKYLNNIVEQDHRRIKRLVLQLRFSLPAVVSGFGFSLVFSPPEGPRHDEAGPAWRPEQETRQKVADLRHRRQKGCQARQTAAGTAGLLSFALPQVARRRSAANRARKAAAARHRLMCRCHPCQERASQWSRPRSSLARSKHSSIVQRSPAAPASSPSETPTGAKAK